MNIQARGLRWSIALAVLGCGGGSARDSGIFGTSPGSDTEMAGSDGSESVSTGSGPGSSSGAESGSSPAETTGTGSEGDTTDLGSTGPDTGPPGSTGTTADGSGDESGTTGGMGDNDGDGLPNHDDPFPGDADLPGVVTANLVYAHTSTTLLTMDVTAPYTVTEIGAFSFPDGEAGQMTDIAIDRFGVLYGITFDDLHVCDPQTAACYALAALPDSSNGLTFVPPGTVDAADDSLIGIAISGNWRHMQLAGAMVNQALLGSYGAGYGSSGDAFSIEGVGTFGSVDVGGELSDVIVEIDPADGSVQQQIATLTGYTAVYGLAGWEGAIFAFDETGDVLLVDPSDGTWQLVADTANAWWGAAVSTQLPSSRNQIDPPPRPRRVTDRVPRGARPPGAR